MKDFLLTMGGFLIGALIGAIILWFVIKNARRQVHNMAEEDEKEWTSLEESEQEQEKKQQEK